VSAKEFGLLSAQWNNRESKKLMPVHQHLSYYSLHNLGILNGEIVGFKWANLWILNEGISGILNMRISGLNCNYLMRK
jgi:hypothetical protein